MEATLEILSSHEVMAQIEEAEKANLEEGEVSDPVYTSGGFHIIKILKKKTPQIKPFEEVKSEIMNDLINNELQRQIEILLKELRRNTYIDVK
jgi:PPIC-type PPIASE domain.